MITTEQEKCYGIVYTRNNVTRLYGKKLWNHSYTALENLKDLKKRIFSCDLPKTKIKKNPTK